MDAHINAKVVILGKTNSGKTCLLERYLHGRYVESVEATIGAAFGSRTVDVERVRVTLGIWDTAGSERYDAMSRVYYRGAKSAIICHDLTDESSFHRAKYWVNELQMYEECCKIYLCGTKLDLFNSNSTEGKSLTLAVQQYAKENLFFIVAEDCAKEIKSDVKDKSPCDLTKDDEPSKKKICCS